MGWYRTYLTSDSHIESEKATKLRLAVLGHYSTKYFTVTAEGDTVTMPGNVYDFCREDYEGNLMKIMKT